MFRLTREVRFAINDGPDEQLTGKPTNGYAGYPSLVGLGRFYVLRVSVTGSLNPASQYLVNIKEIDALVREHGIPLVRTAVLPGTGEHTPAFVTRALFKAFGPLLAAGTTLDRGPEDAPPAGRVAVFRDPFGHRWFLNQPSP